MTLCESCLQHNNPTSKLITSTNHSARSHPLQNNKTTATFTAWSKAAFVLQHTWDWAWNVYPSSQMLCFHLAVKRQRQSFWLKRGLQLAKNTGDRGRCSLSLPPLSGLPFKRSDSHENPKRPSVPVLYPALTAAALPTNTHTHTHTQSIYFTPMCALLLQRGGSCFCTREWGGEKHQRGKEKEEVTKFSVKTTSSVFRN